MDLPILSWKEYTANCEYENVDPYSNDLQEARFENWMKERAALNSALLALNNIGNHSIGIANEIIKTLYKEAV